MMIGTCDVKNGTIVTNKTTYVVTADTRPDVRRMFLVPGLVIGAGLSLLGIGFADVLYVHEIGLIIIAVAVSLIGGTQFARLVILDKVTRGTEQESANYGMHSTLQAKRREINAAIVLIKEDGMHSRLGDLS